ncbi:MAG: ABC transporter permease [Actinomycetia bacterium]|nr:ABC transporter permease [Actinomycetes bacterium]
MGGNVATVIAFEVARTLRKKSFWVAALVVPVLMGVVMAVTMRSSASVANGTAASAQTAAFTFEYVDESGLVDGAIASAAGGTRITDPAQGLADVKSGAVAAFIHWPSSPATDPTTVAGQDVGLFNSDKYTSMAVGIMQASASAKVGDPALVQVAAGHFTVNLTTYSDGKQSGGVGALLPPLIFLIAFYLVMIMQGNRMLSSSLEEKENRVTEMILTTVKSSSLLAGKVISLVIVGVVQMLVTIVPVVIAAFVVQRSMVTGLLSNLEFNPQRMILGALLLIAGFLLFTGGCVAIGAAVPTVRDASSMFTVVMLVLLAPFFVFTMIMANPNTPIVQVFSYFPFTAPVTGMIRNAVGNLSWGAGLAEVAISLVFAWLVFLFAVRLYQYGSVEYDKKLDWRIGLRR